MQMANGLWASSNTETAFGVMGGPRATFSLIPGSAVRVSALSVLLSRKRCPGCPAVLPGGSLLGDVHSLSCCLHLHQHHIFISISIAVSFPPRPSCLSHPISNAISIPSHPLSHPHSSSNLHPSSSLSHLHSHPISNPISIPISFHSCLCSTPSYPIPFPTPSPSCHHHLHPHSQPQTHFHPLPYANPQPYPIPSPAHPSTGPYFALLPSPGLTALS